MPITFHSISVATHIRGLKVLSHILDLAKAHATEKEIPFDDLLKWRLIDTMEPLSFQINYVCITARTFLTSLNIFIPDSTTTATTFSEHETEIVSTISLLQTITSSQIEGKEDEVVKQEARVTERYGSFTAYQFLVGRNMPNFWFHVVTAYDILRAGGVELGKREFLKCHFEEFLGPDGKGTAGV